jgi:hypothetical protein
VELASLRLLSRLHLIITILHVVLKTLTAKIYNQSIPEIYDALEVHNDKEAVTTEGVQKACQPGNI